MASRLDPETLRRLAELDQGNPGFFARIFDIYECETRKKLDALFELLSGYDSAEIAKIAHSLKGSSITLGATLVAELAAQIELEPSLIGEIFPILNLECENAISELKCFASRITLLD